MSKTLFTKVYDAFFRKITEDMYMELTKEDTESMVQELLLSALSWFEFPRVDINDYSLVEGCFNVALSLDEINIISTYMVKEWLGQQLASVENTRMKYSGSDFKFTSQANHMAKLKNLVETYKQEGFHLQRLYKRRKKDVNGIYRSTMGEIMGNSKETQSSGSASSGCQCSEEIGEKVDEAVDTKLDEALDSIVVINGNDD